MKVWKQCEEQSLTGGMRCRAHVCFLSAAEQSDTKPQGSSKSSTKSDAAASDKASQVAPSKKSADLKVPEKSSEPTTATTEATEATEATKVSEKKVVQSEMKTPEKEKEIPEKEKQSPEKGKKTTEKESPKAPAASTAVSSKEFEKVTLEGASRKSPDSTAPEAVKRGLPDKVPYLIVGAGTAAFAAYRAVRSRDPTAQVNPVFLWFLLNQVCPLKWKVDVEEATVENTTDMVVFVF